MRYSTLSKVGVTVLALVLVSSMHVQTYLFIAHITWILHAIITITMAVIGWLKADIQTQRLMAMVLHFIVILMADCIMLTTWATECTDLNDVSIIAATINTNTSVIAIAGKLAKRAILMKDMALLV